MTKKELHLLVVSLLVLLAASLLISVFLYSQQIRLNGLEGFLIAVILTTFLVLFVLCVIVLNGRISSAKGAEYLLLYIPLAFGGAIWIGEVISALVFFVALPFTIIFAVVLGRLFRVKWG